MDIEGFVSAALEWAEKHPGLAAWIALVVAILAAAAGWYALRFESERTNNVEFNAGIDRIKEVVANFNSDFNRYLEECKEFPGDAKAPNRVTMNRLASMTVLQWPSMASFESFHYFWNKATEVLEADQKEIAKPRLPGFMRQPAPAEFSYANL
jgi:hypothetical protein